MKRVGIIGVGLLGSAVAIQLIEGGFKVVGYDTRPEPVAALVGRGLEGATSIVAAAATDAVFTILPTPAVVEEVWLGRGGLLQTAPSSTVLIQMSTISPVLSRRLGETAGARGFKFLEAPISGASRAVARGVSTIW